MNQSHASHPLNALRAFTVAARHRSLTRAGEELHVTPAAVGHQVRALEDYLGVKGNDTGLPFPEALEKQIEAQEYVAIFMPTKGGNRDLRSMIKQYYRVVEQREMVVGTNRFTMDLGTFVPRATPGGRRSR